MGWRRGLEDWHEHRQQIFGDRSGRSEAGSATEVQHLSFEVPARLTVAKVHFEGSAGNGVPRAVQASRDRLLRVLAPDDHTFSAEATGGHDEEPNWTGAQMIRPLGEALGPKAREHTVSTVPRELLWSISR